jgi:hypothetical protein
MNRRTIVILGWMLSGMLVFACVAAQLPVRLPSVSIPAVPSLPSVTLPSVSAPGIALPTLAVPGVNAPAIGLTLVGGIAGTPVPTTSAIPAVPVTGNAVAGEVLKWLIYGLLLVAGVVLVIALFRRAMRRPNGPDEPPDRPNI